MSTVTFDENHVRVTGVPNRYFENKDKTTGKTTSVKLLIDIGNNQIVPITMWMNDGESPPFTEEKFKAASTVTVLGGKMTSWTNNTTKELMTEVQAKTNQVILNTGSKINVAYVGGTVTSTGENNKFTVDISYTKKRGGAGKSPEYGVRTVRVSASKVPEKGKEVIVSGALAVTGEGKARKVEIAATEVIVV